MYRAFISGGDGGHSPSRRNSSANAAFSPSSLKNAISLTIRVDTFLWLTLQRLQHFALSATPRLHASGYVPMNGVPYFLYAALTVVRDLEFGPAEGVHLNDTSADRKR